MQTPANPAVRWLLYALAAVVVFMAVVVGAARLLLPLVPDYQDDIRVWASEATGYDIRFSGIGASWPITGPELTFYGVSLTRPGEAAAVIAAEEFSAGLSLWRLLRDARPSLGRVSLRGTSLRVERTADGGLRVQGRALQDLLPKFSGRKPPEVDLEITDVALSYTDLRRDPEPVALVVDRLRASLERDAVSASASLRLPDRLGRELELEFEVPAALPAPLALPPDWQGRAEGRGVDLARLAVFLLGESGPLRTARGDARLDLEVAGGRPSRLVARVDLREVAVGSPAAGAAYERLAGELAWQRRESDWSADVRGLRLRRGGRDSPPVSATIAYGASPGEGGGRWSLGAEFLRLDDLFPLVRALAAGSELEARLPRALRGELRDLEAEFADQRQEPGRYSVRVDFQRLGGTSPDGAAAVTNLAGSLAADGDGGRLQLASRDVDVTAEPWFRETLRAGSVEGLLVWRAGAGGVRLLSDNIHLQSDAIDIRSRLALDFPAGEAGSAVIDLKASASATQAREVLRYLPLRRFPPKVVEWLERAVVSGQVPSATVVFRGPVREFPYDHGEGTFRVDLDLQDATLDYANGWPRVEKLQAAIAFDGVGMSGTARGARIGPLAVRDFAVSIPDLRRGILAISGRQRVGLEQVLEFLRETPLSTRIGPALGQVTGAGPVDAALRLALPVTRLNDYDLQVLFDARSCQLGWGRLPLDLRDLRGRVRLQNTRFSGNGLRAVMLGEPVDVALLAEQGADGSITHVAKLRGETPVARVTSTFNLPLRQYFDGRLAWDASVTLPPRRERRPTRVTVALQSDLRGVSSSLPAPLAKPAPDAWPTELRLDFPEENAIELSGRATPPLAWSARLVQAPAGGGWTVERGSLRLGPGTVRLPARRGVEVSGRVAALDLGEWLALGGDGEGRAFRETYRAASLQLDSFTVAGQVFREVNASAERGVDAWNVRISGPSAAGDITVPFDTTARPLVLKMQRLWLTESAPEEGGDAPPPDPRRLPAMEVSAEDAALGSWRLGRLEASVARVADGLVARRLAARAASFQIDGNGAWRVDDAADPRRQTTRIDAALVSTDLQATLQQLGYGPVLTGQAGRVRAELAWPGGPKANFLAVSSGRLAVELKDGQVAEVEPGGSGRLLGLLSVTALPRRLALDFSDVFRKGLAFDSVKGEFRVGGGSAYTCNLGLSGPAVDIGVVGRAGFAARDYDQYAVVRPEVSSVLTVGGVVLGGPVGGATMLLISQLFRKPLSTLGESYYRVSGPWDSPAVDRVQRDKVDVSAFKDCEAEVTAALRAEQQASGPPPQ